MNVEWVRRVVIVGSLLASGCATRAHAVSSHTVQVAPGQETDVVWFARDDETVFRCVGQGATASCSAVRAP